MADKGATSPVAVAEAGGNAAPNAGSAKKPSSAKTKAPRAKPSHPKTADMVNSAIKELKERGGSSLQAIKKYMATKYKVDTEKQATFIKKYLKSAVASGALVQTKGKGAAGSFKLSVTKSESAKPKVKKVAKAAAPKKAPAKKPTAAKKPVAAKKAPVKKAAATAAVAQKKKVPKGPAAKPPKPKTTKAKPAAKAAVKKAKPASPKKPKAAAAKPKKVAAKKAPAAKK